MPDSNEQFARNGAAFAIKLFNQISAEGIKENLIFSPFSIQACVALAFAGAHGKTADDIANVMMYVSNSQTKVGETFHFVLEKYKNSTLLKVANKAYVQRNFCLKQSYQQSLTKYYYADAEVVNFVDNINTAKAMNSWVESKTAGKIKNLISPDWLDDLTNLVLLNALYFKGNWQLKFDEKKTAKDSFWIGEKQSIKIDYMQKLAKLRFGNFSKLECTAIEMPYKDSDLSMFVLLPNKREGLKNLIENLKTINLIDLVEKMSNEEVQVIFPKFKFDFSIELTKILKALGLTCIFENPDFSNMLESAENLKVSKIVHKVSIEVNEEGTVAAAATGIVVVTLSAGPSIVQFNADHPFLYIIWNKKNILFAGAFVNAPKG